MAVPFILFSSLKEHIWQHNIKNPGHFLKYVNMYLNVDLLHVINEVVSFFFEKHTISLFVTETHIKVFIYLFRSYFFHVLSCIIL